MLNTLYSRTSLLVAASFALASLSAAGCNVFDRSDVNELASAAHTENAMGKPPKKIGQERDCLEICRYECADEVNRTGCLWICRCESP